MKARLPFLLRGGMFLDLKDETLCDPRSGDAGEDRWAENRESYRHVTLLRRRTHSHCNDRIQGPARYSSVPVEGGSHRGAKALPPAHIEKGRLHHPCGSLHQLTAGWVKVGLQRRCLAARRAVLPAPALAALVAGTVAPRCGLCSAVQRLHLGQRAAQRCRADPGDPSSPPGSTRIQRAGDLLSGPVSSETACAAEASFKGTKCLGENDGL